MSTNITAESIYKAAQYLYAIKRLEAMPIEVNVPMPSEWAKDYRYLPKGTSEYYGKFDPLMVPHLIQPMNDCHPDSPYTHITNMKSVQSASTVTLAENVLGFYIKYMLGSILFLTSTKTMAGIRGSANIDVMIDHSGLAHHLKPASNRSGHKSKDNSLYKEFLGGIKLLMTSYNSIADLKSNTFHLIIEDELDEAGVELKDQGDVEGIIEGRTMGLLNYKILQISTSSRAETSRINKNFLQGDQNEYFVPCPHCGELQTLEMKGKGLDYGLTFTREKNKTTGNKILIPESVRYLCKFCGKDIRESKKLWMLQNGEWRAQAIPEDRKRRSYHSPGLISPFLGWERICQQFIKSDFGNDLMVFKDFTINYLGNPWAAVKKAASWENLRDRSEPYILGEVPEGQMMQIGGESVYVGPLMMFGGVDVQGDRLELFVKGLGANGEEWAIDYQIFYGHTEDINDSSWVSLREFVQNKTYGILGVQYNIAVTAVDSGWDPKKAKRDKDYTGKAHTVYEFVSQCYEGWFIAVMGVDDDKTVDVIKEAKINGPLSKRYNVAVSLLKETLMNRIEQSAGYGTVHFPRFQVLEDIKREIPDEFYRQFLSERYQEDPKSPGKYGWFKIHQRNEPLDTWGYATAASVYYNVHRWTNADWMERYYAIMEAKTAG